MPRHNVKVAVVAGGAGFIGSHLCEYLLKKNYRVYAVDNLITGRRKNIESLLQHSDFTWIDHDIINPLLMNSPCDEIYNLASPASPVDFEKFPDFILKTAALGHLNLLNWARTHNSKILFASTSEIYGDPLIHPQVESYLGNVDCTGIRGCYDEGKRFGEALSMSYRRKYKLQTRIARIFNTYGPRMRPEDGRVIPNFFTQALAGKPLTVYGDGKQTRSLCYVTDLVEGLYRLMQSEIHLPINIGNPQEMTILEIAKAVSEACSVKLETESKPLPPSDPRLRRPDISKAKTLLKWSPQTSLSQGMILTCNYFKNLVP